MDTIKFKVGVTYYARSIGDHNCIYRGTIEKRTEKTVWVKDPRHPNDKIQSRRVDVRDGVEGFYPFGKYSFAPYFSADEVYDPETVKSDWKV